MEYDEERMMQERREKQLYLKSEIIEKNYDGAQFAEYLNGLREDGGSNIDMWSIKELKQHVVDFKRIMDQKAPVYEEPYEVLDNPAPVEQIVQQVQERDREPDSPVSFPRESGLNDATKEDDYTKVIPVKKSEESVLNGEKNLAVIVGEPELVKGGLFSASYIQYTVTTMPFGWQVKRRFSDFFWLRSVLQKMHLGYIIPPVPQKKNKGKFENDFIRKRMYFLDRFMNACISNEEFKSNKYLYFFLFLTDVKQLNAKIKESEKVVKATRIEDVHNLLGEVYLEINPNLKYYAANAGELCGQIDPIYKKIRKLSKQLIQDLDAVSNTIFTLGEGYAALYAASSSFNKNISIGKNTNLDDTYLTLNNMMVSWGEQVLGQIKIVTKHMSYFYKYASYENESFKEVVQARGKAGLDYITKKRELIVKKERLFLQADISKWELEPIVARELHKEQLLKNKNLAFDVMLPKETHFVKELRDTFSYQNALAFMELDKNLNEKCRAYSNNFHEFAKAQAENLTEVHVHWADLMAHFTESKSKLKNAANIAHSQIMNRDTVTAKNNEDEFKGYGQGDYE